MGRSELRFQVEELYADYAACLDDGELERWPEFFTDDAVYKIMPRDNYERGLPLALVACESKGMLQDRVAALRHASVFAPRSLRHLVSSMRITPSGGSLIHVRANYAVLETRVDDETRISNAGRYIDQLVRVDGELKIKAKLCICDTVLLSGALIYPI